MTPSASPSTAPVPTALPSEGEEPIYLAIIWHQHQPVYTKNPETGAYVRPWVRVHATKDYVDMAAILEQYPTVHATFNLTPSLIRQLDDLAAGAKDLYWILAEIPAAELDDEQRQFILDRFFDTNRRIIARVPDSGRSGPAHCNPPGAQIDPWRQTGDVALCGRALEPGWFSQQRRDAGSRRAARGGLAAPLAARPTTPE
jgi:alpha-amylase/alpha-mannosidase (GH57 family)